MRNERLVHAIDAIERKTQLVPPGQIHDVGDGDYLEISREFLEYFVSIGNLQPSHHVLDIGCGTGRMAAGLVEYLDASQGKYFGFDPSKSGIEWCKQAFNDLENFDFQWIDVANELYNPEGKTSVSDVVLPGDIGKIDFFILTSIFTHMYENEIQEYIKKIKSHKSDSACIFATAYLYSGNVPPKGVSDHLNFSVHSHREPRRWHVAGLPPLSAVCYHEGLLQDMFEKEFGASPSIYPGRWRDGPGPWFQDLVIA